MLLKGTVIEIIFRNEENGYTVFDMDADGRLVTAVGIFPEILEGESLGLIGEFKENSRYGEQFEVREVVFETPTDIAGIYNFLCSGLFRGVGEVTASAIVNKFGLQTLEIIEKTPERLKEVAGIGKQKALDIKKAFQDTVEMRNTILFLQKHSIPMSQALKIYKVYGSKTEEKLQDNPYSLVQDIDGIGFYTADKIAEKLGVDMDSDFRIMAGITHVLNESARHYGHTCLPQSMLVEETKRLLANFEEDRIVACFPKMIINGLIKVKNLKGSDVDEPIIALAINYNTENSISLRLAKLSLEAKDLDVDPDREIEIYEKENDIYLHEMQKEAVRNAVTKGSMVITGGPGTGKTTIIKCILDIYKTRKLKALLCSPTGRASKRLSEATGEEASTIHRMLGFDMSSGKPKFCHDEYNPLQADVVIVDEISMADIFIFNAMLKAMPKGARLILVGDKDQLPSVSAGNILADVIESGLFPVVSLTEIYRQDEGSLIVSNAHRINRGEMPVIDNRSGDFFVENKESASELVDSTVSLVSRRLKKYFGISERDIQVLCPVKKGLAGVENLNKVIQDEVNPDGKSIEIKGVTFRVGDKVMHTANNYELEWTRNVGYVEEGQGVFNGEIGYVVDIIRGEIVVEFDDGKIVYYDRASQEDLMLAYAVSVHKSQGSEYPAVVLVLANSGGNIMNRNLLYTAVTRAKKVVVIVGAYRTIARMVNTDYTAKRWTLLKEFIFDNVKKLGLLG